MRQGIIAKRTGTSRVLSTLMVAAGLIVWTAGPASASVFSNTAAITIPSSGTIGSATPYPSPIAVSGLDGTIVDVNVTLMGLSHTYPDDIDVLLVSPLGQNVVLMADVGSGFDVTSIGLTFDDAAVASLPGSAQIVAGTFKPTVDAGGAFGGPAPAPVGPYGTTLSVFNGTAPSGTWNLFVYDDVSIVDGGSISGGWSLDILATPTITSFAPARGMVGDTVVITGTSLTGTSAVSFDGIPAVSFTVDSGTQVTATVPAGATTGPISLTTPGGTTASATDFVVKHPRDVSLAFSGNKARGKVSVTDGYSACRSGVPIKVQRLKKGNWKTVGSTLTKANGTYRVPGLTLSGKYRTVAKKTKLSSGDVCLKDISPKVKK